MAVEVMTKHTDNHYSEEIDHLLLKMINEVREINYRWKTNPSTVSLTFVNSFIPDFIKLYDLTGDHLRIKHPKTEDAVNLLVSDTIYYLDGIIGSNGHTQNVDSKAIIDGINKFRRYKFELQKEGIMVVY